MLEFLKNVITLRYASANFFELNCKRSGSSGEKRIAFEATVDGMETWIDAIKTIAFRKFLFRMTTHLLIRSLKKVKVRVFRIYQSLSTSSQILAHAPYSVYAFWIPAQ